MPRIKRRAKRRREYHSEEIKLLQTGVSLMTRFGAIHKGYGDFAGLREAWNELRGELMEQWIAEHPFTRPWAWLLFDAVAPRLRTVGEQRMESQQEVEARGLYGGDYRRCYFQTLNHRLGAEETRTSEGDWETEQQYLSRIGALTESELALL